MLLAFALLFFYVVPPAAKNLLTRLNVAAAASPTGASALQPAALPPTAPSLQPAAPPPSFRLPHRVHPHPGDCVQVGHTARFGQNVAVAQRGNAWARPGAHAPARWRHGSGAMAQRRGRAHAGRCGAGVALRCARLSPPLLTTTGGSHSPPALVARQ